MLTQIEKTAAADLLRPTLLPKVFLFPNCLLSTWTLGFLFFSNGYNSLLSSIILLPKLSLIWPLGTPSN